ncbi:uncharacterized protein LOC101850538 [Aplysia californica]|uniref:Uncharacterized protein LOC101850538 n=1 Tax=Aplysia californica TaxID=6500 RepID=A0ABM0JEX7_APLCA|nr:uncharacterized protein LOC101850538 [Aplysia californica]
MTTSIRRNTFVLKDPTLPGSSSVPSTGMDRQNIMRLKVNRIALVQELRVEHITGLLMESGVVGPKDLKKIESGRTPQDKARILVDLLPTKSKDSDWYKHFRDALQNPDGSADTRRRYRLLVEFLDNTVIHRPTSQVGRFRDSSYHKNFRPLSPLHDGDQENGKKLQRYQPLPSITHKTHRDDDGIKMYGLRASDGDIGADLEDGLSMLSVDSHRNMTLVKGFFHQWLPTPDNFRSLIEIDQNHQQRLMSSPNPEDQLLMAREEIALKNLRKLEVISALARRKQLPSGFELCMCDAVQDILSQSELFHLYMKHLHTLEEADVMLVRDITASYETVLQMLDSSSMSEIVNQVIQTGLRFASLLIAVNKFDNADGVLVSTISFLKQNSELDSWLPRYHAYVKLMQARNLSCKPDKAQSTYFDAVQMQFQIQMMSFGQNLIQQGAMHAETSFMLLEYGSIVSALGWARRALMEVDPEDSAAIVRTLCVGVSAYCAQWLVSKAEMLAVYAVQFAREKFGERHPLYIEALQHFCQFNNEFKQDAVGLQAANELLDAAEKTYGCESLQVAYAHRAISKARMCMHMMDTDDYYRHAVEAVRIARACLGQRVPQLHVFLHTMASALQWKALHCPKEVHDSTLRWAEGEAKLAYSLVTETFGEISLKSAQMLLLLGQIYSKMNQHPEIKEDLLDVAARHLTQAVDYLKLCQPASSNYLLLGMATLGTFYKIVMKPELAVPRFKYVVDHAESTGWYLKWMHMCFESLASLYSSMGQDKEADVVQVKLSHWLKANPVTNNPVDYSRLEKDPEPFANFVKKADLWGAALQRMMAVPSGKTLVKVGEDNDNDDNDEDVVDKDDEQNAAGYEGGSPVDDKGDKVPE